MQKTTAKHRHNRNGEFDLYDDIAKIKAALADATYDVKGMASEMLHQSIENAKSRSTAAQDNLSNYIAERPFKTIGIAMLSGLLIGYLLRK